MLNRKSGGNGRGGSWRDSAGSRGGEAAAPAASGASGLVSSSSSVSADWNPCILHVAEKFVVRVCAVLYGCRRFLKIGKVVRKSENSDNKELRKFLHCAEGHGCYMCVMGGLIQREDGSCCVYSD